MIPFAIPEDNQILNLNHIVSVSVWPATDDTPLMIEVSLSNGETAEYNGKAAEVVMAEVTFCLNHHRSVQTAILTKMNEQNGGIIVPQMTM